MTKTYNQQFKSLDSIDFVRDLTSETAANYSGGACTFADTASTFEPEPEPNFYSYEGMEYLQNPVNNNLSGFTTFDDNSTWWR